MLENFFKILEENVLTFMVPSNDNDALLCYKTKKTFVFENFLKNVKTSAQN